MSVSIPIGIVVEDSLSDEVVRVLLERSGRPYCIGTTYGLSGYGYIRSRVSGFNNAAKGMPYFVLTDLDFHECASKLMNDWLPKGCHGNLLFRIAVREVEAWLLGDHVSLAEFLGIRQELIPNEVDVVPDPKRTLVALASKSRYRSLRSGIVPKAGSTSKQGPDYNGSLIRFVRNIWRPEEAMLRSPSLAKTIGAISKFAPRYSP